MPGYDTTGPQGKGPLTGKGFRRCKVENESQGELFASTVHSNKENKPAIIQDPIEDCRGYRHGKWRIPCGCRKESGFRRGKSFQF